MPPRPWQRSFAGMTDDIPDHSEPLRPASVLLDAVVPVTACLLLLSAALKADYLSDDAFITFRYAHNILRGLGPVYNSGTWRRSVSS